MDFSILLEHIKGPEFWMSFSFFAVLLVAFNPLKKYLAKWGKERADKIQKSLDEPADLRKKAEELLKKYETHTQNQEQERTDILTAAEEEVLALQKENKIRLTDRMERKHIEMTNRLQTIQENGVKQMKDQMVGIIVNKAQDILKKNQNTPVSGVEMDKALNLIFHSLTENKDLIKRD